MVPGSAGQMVPHPAVGEARQQRITLSRLLGQFDLPDEHGAPVIATPRQASARKAAATRWAGSRTATSIQQDGA